MSLIPYIHTLSRHNNQVTLESLSPSLRKKVRMVIQPHEVEEHERYASDIHEILVLPKSIRTLGPTRQWILDHAATNDHDKIVMLDDDLWFHIRKSETDLHLRTPTAKELNKLFAWIQRDLGEEYPIVGVSPREGNIREERDWNENCRMMRLLAFHVPTVHPRAEFRDDVDGMNDFDFILKILRQGYKNKVIWKYAQGHKGTQTPGGCSIMRTHETHEMGAKKMHEYHGRFVQLREKHNKTGGEFGKRTEITVYWKQAYLHGRAMRADFEREECE